jgi:hypothetical protein
METVFGDRLIKYVPATADKVSLYEAELKAANEAGTDLPEHPSQVSIPITNVARTPYVAVLFTAEYGPPC